ncbi:MAG: hypothetical protein FD169_296 [Bacillota bacterium]|nr:MAG: hypothetical protein FD169_296 [Bacillota bacterium]
MAGCTHYSLITKERFPVFRFPLKLPAAPPCTVYAPRGTHYALCAMCYLPCAAALDFPIPRAYTISKAVMETKVLTKALERETLAASLLPLIMYRGRSGALGVNLSNAERVCPLKL